MINEILTDIAEELEHWCMDQTSLAIRYDRKEEVINKYIENKVEDYNIYFCIGNRLILHSIKLKKDVKAMYLPMKDGDIRLDVAGKLPLYLKAIEKTLNYLDNRRI